MRFRFMSNGDTVFLPFFFCGFISHLIDGYTINMSKSNVFTVFFFFDTFWDLGDYLERNGIILWSLGYRSNHHMVCCCSNKLQIASSSHMKHHTWSIIYDSLEKQQDELRVDHGSMHVSKKYDGTVIYISVFYHENTAYLILN